MTSVQLKLGIKSRVEVQILLEEVRGSAGN